jgi:hypothetical protein
VLGTGAELSEPNGAFAPVVLDDVRPDADLTSVTASGIEPPAGTDANWNVKAFAICANR